LAKPTWCTHRFPFLFVFLFLFLSFYLILGSLDKLYVIGCALLLEWSMHHIVRTN